MFASKWHDVSAVADFVDGKTLCVLVIQEDGTWYTAVGPDRVSWHSTEWERGFLVRYELGANAGEAPEHASIELLYSRAPTEVNGLGNGRMGATGVLSEYAARNGLDASARDLESTRESDVPDLKHLWRGEVPKADATRMRELGFPVEQVQ